MTDYDEGIDRCARLAESFADWMWAEKLARGWEQEIDQLQQCLSRGP